MLKNKIEKIILGKDKSLISWVVRLLLIPFTALYIAGLWAFLYIYKCGFRKQYKLETPVISVGNLTFGGTGKTPIVQTIAKLLQNSGRKVVVLSRGHGGKAKSSVVVSNGSDITASLSSSGDEPMLLAKSLPGIPVFVGKDRRQSGRLAEELFKPDIILLDDGMQYWQLYRDINITVLDAKNPIGSGFVMPAGDLREPIRGLARADIVIINKRDSKVDSTKVELPNLYDAKVFKSRIIPIDLKRVSDNIEISFDSIKGKKITAFCGIGNPDAFFDMLEEFGANLVSKTAFADHHAYNQADLQQIKQFQSDMIITTEKDFVKLADWQAIYDKLYVLRIRAEIEDIKGFEEYITNRINTKN